MTAKDRIRLPQMYEQNLGGQIKSQLRAIGVRIYNIVAPAIQEARSAADEPASLRPLAAAHDTAIAVFESESLGYFHNVAGGLELLRSLACKAGCAFCCNLKVDITALEAAVLWAGLAGDAHAAQRQALVETAPRTMGLDTEGRRQARIPCALLVEGSCSVYAHRPYGCRGLFSTNAADCERVLLTAPGVPLPPIRSPSVPRGLSAIFGAGVNAALEDCGLQSDFLELNSALATFINRPTTLQDWLAGLRVFPAARLG